MHERIIFLSHPIGDLCPRGSERHAQADHLPVSPATIARPETPDSKDTTSGPVRLKRVTVT